MSKTLLRLAASFAVLGMGGVLGHTQSSTGPVLVTIKDGKVSAAEPTFPVDPTERIKIGHTGSMYFGLTVEGKLISCSPQGSIWASARIDNQEFNPGFGNMQNVGGQQQPLSPGPFGKKRPGTRTTYKMGSLDIVQTIEIVPSKPVGKTSPGAKRKMDTARITYLVQNTDSRPHTVEWKVGIDILVNGNDGALFASPMTHPNKVLDGVVLKDKTLPEFLQVLERPNLKDPGFVATMTFQNGGRVEAPNRVVLTGLGALGMWEVPAMQANGDSACAIYWAPKMLKPGEKRELVWAYGGGIASTVENEGTLSLALGGSFEPGKLFTITAFIDDPVPSQTLTLELPPGMVRMEGKEIQPVAAPNAGTGVVLWKARVEKTGDYDVKVHSSSGVTQIKSISIRNP